MAHGWQMTRLAASLAPVLLLGACVSTPGCSKPAAPAGFEVVEIGGRTFTLELVADNDTRVLGLGGRTSIPEDGGMLFSFPDSQIRQFVMRDCLVDIDIIFLDTEGLILAMHHMPVEEPKRPEESASQYEMRLKRYSSRFNARYVIELRGGMLENLDLQTGQQIKLDTKRLAEITR
jgi:uncharacterized membrane protein (UPF0127 family)